MLKKKFVLLLAPCLLVPSLLSSPAVAQMNHDGMRHGDNDHPGYIQALSDLRYARANLDVNSYPDVTPQTRKAVKEIDDAIGAIKQGATSDRENMDQHPPVDSQKKPHERFQDAIAALNKAHSEVAGDEDNRKAQGDRRRALDNIDAARINAEQALGKARADYEREHGGHR